MAPDARVPTLNWSGSFDCSDRIRYIDARSLREAGKADITPGQIRPAHSRDGIVEVLILRRTASGGAVVSLR